MKFPLPVASGSFTSNAIGMVVHENGAAGLAVEILSHCIINIKNCQSLKRGAYRPDCDCTYKTANNYFI